MLHIKIKLSLMCHTLALCMGTQNYRLNFLAHPKSEAIFFYTSEIILYQFSKFKKQFEGGSTDLSIYVFILSIHFLGFSCLSEKYYLEIILSTVNILNILFH